MTYVIRCTNNPGLFWSNETGWGSFDGCERLAFLEGDLPLEGEVVDVATIHDEVVKWVGQHYKVNFEAESATRQHEWQNRYLETFDDFAGADAV